MPPLFAHLLELGAIALINVVAVGVGLRALILLRVAMVLSLGERLVFGLGLGYGALAFLIFTMGALGIIYRPVALAGLLALGALAVGPLRNEALLIGPALRRALGGLRYLPNLFLLSVILVATGAALIKALAPVATQDDLMYHLALPRLYVETHALTFAPDSSYSLFPQLMEMLYTWGLLLGSERLSVLFAFSNGILGAAVAALYAKRYLGSDQPGPWPGVWRALPLLVAALFLSSPLIGFVLRAANTDFAQASFDLLGLYAIFLGIKDDRRPTTDDRRPTTEGRKRITDYRLPTTDYRLLVLSGICCGLSFSVKYYGAAVPFFLGVGLVAVLFWRRSSISTLIRATLAFSLPVIAIAAVWLIRNYVAAGNPVWPAAGDIFGGAYWSPQAAPEVLLGTVPGLSLESLRTGLEYHWNAISRGPLSIDNQRHVVSVGPLLIFSLLLLPFARWRAALGWLFYLAAATWVLAIFYFSRASIRYLMTVFLLCATMGGYVLVSVAGWGRAVRWALSAVVGVALAALALESALSTGPYLPTVFALDQDAERQYLAAHMEEYPIIRYIEEQTPPTSKIYVWDSRPRGYRIPRPYVYGRLVPKYSGVSSDLESWHARLRELGITHVLQHKRLLFAPTYPVGYDPDAELFQAFAEQYLGPPLIEVGQYTLYELRGG